MELPPEINYEALLNVPDLLAVCSSSSKYREICSSRSFWLAKFRRENLIPLEEGLDFPSWYSIYEASKRAALRTKFSMDWVRKIVNNPWEARLLRVEISDISSPFPLSVPEVPEETIQKFLEESRIYGSNREIRKRIALLEEELESGRFKRLAREEFQKEINFLQTLLPPRDLNIRTNLEVWFNSAIGKKPARLEYDLGIRQSSFGPGYPNIARYHRQAISLESLELLFYKLYYFNIETGAIEVTELIY